MDEDDVASARYENAPVRGAEGMWNEDVSHDQGVYKFEQFG
jgi:hypothetical protein